MDLLADFAPSHRKAWQSFPDALLFAPPKPKPLSGAGLSRRKAAKVLGVSRTQIQRDVSKMSLKVLSKWEQREVL
jgi:hypothetical protein